MHYHLEIVMPPTDDVEKSVGEIMEPFNENNEEATHPFWDFWVIGGRWSGAKIEARLGDERLDAFYKKLKEEKVTVSGVQCGKQELYPSSQIGKVDMLWQDYFPDSGLDVCPLFKHSNDQFSSSSVLPGDICSLGETPTGMKAGHVIVACPNCTGEKMEAEYMIQESIWNGVTHVPTKWDGTLEQAISNHNDWCKNMADTFRERATPRPDWLVVTVDYHS